MATFDILRFDTAPSVADGTFRDVDTAMQHWCYLNLPGIQRRTTARHENHWIVVQLFDSPDHCGIDYLDSTDEAVRTWTAMIDRSTLVHETYTLL